VSDDQEKSLGDAATFAGAVKHRSTAEISIGDERTLGDGLAGQETIIDDIEVVDLDARYRIEGELGQGGMGAVLLATDTRLDRKVAIKRILGEAAGNRMAVQRFLTEAKSIAALNHPNVVQIYDYGRAKDGPFLIMEFVDGGSLLDRCRDGAMPLEHTVDLACQLCDGLAKAHDLSIVHRDIKPANVLLTKDGVPKLTDFGLAKAQSGDHGQTMTGAVLGTPDFMPPEQRRDASLVDHRSDLWSLAATVYQMATGRSPKIIRFDLLPPELTKVLGKALEDAKDHRYQSVREFRDALRTTARAALAAVPGIAGDIREGTCLACGVQNEPNRKFCKSCATSLLAACLKCGDSMPVWDEVCGACGAKQAPLVEAKHNEMAAAQAKAEGLLGDFKFDDALAVAAALRDEPHAKLRHLTGWAEEFVRQVESTRAEQTRQAVELLTEAGKHEAAYDYLAAVFTLEAIPDSLRSSTLPDAQESVAKALERLQARQKESRSLEAKVKALLAAKAVDDLLPVVQRLLQIQPNRADIQKLRAQLEDRNEKLIAARDEAIRDAQSRLAAYDYEDAEHVLRRIKGWTRNETVDRLQAEASRLLAETRGLAEDIGRAVAAKQLDGLLATVEKYLKLKPADDEVRNLRQSLVEREEKYAAEVARRLESAQALGQESRFSEAVDLLERIAVSRRSEEVTSHLKLSKRLAERQEKAMTSLSEAKEGHYAAALTLGESYRSALAHANLSDEKFATLMASVEAADADYVRTRMVLRYTGFTAVGIAAVVSIVAAGLWIRSTIRVAFTTYAIAQNRWDDALAIDPNNVAALVGRARTKLQADPADISGAFADLEKAERQPGATVIAEPARVEAHAIRAAVEARAGRLDRASEDLEAAIRRGADEAALGPARTVIAETWLGRGRDSAAKGDGASIRTATAAALAVGADRQAVIAVWREYVRGRIANLDAKGLQLACIESKKVGLAAEDEAGWWLELAAKAIQSPGVDTAVLRTAMEAAKVAGAAKERLLTVWQAYAAARIADCDLAGLKFTCAEGEKLGLAGETRAGWWLELAEKAIQPPREDMAVLRTALEAAKMAGATAESVAPVKARGLLLEASGLVTAGDMRSAAAKAMEATLLDITGSVAALKLPANEALRATVVVDYRGRLNVGLSGGDWESVLRTATAAGALDDTASEWVGAAIAKHTGGLSAVPPEVLGRLPAATIAGLPPAAIAALPPATIVALPLATIASLPRTVVTALPPIRNSIGMEMKLIPSGTYMMGTGSSERPRNVRITQPFFLGVCEVTNDQFEQVMGVVPSKWRDKALPVESVQWNDAIDFCHYLSQLPNEKASGHTYRLPTNAEWEYACRADSSETYSFGDIPLLDGGVTDDTYIRKISPHGWDSNNSGAKTHPVGKKLPNAWGLHDMHGNVAEWCNDWFGQYSNDGRGAKDTVLTDPLGPLRGDGRVIRGGDWHENFGAWQSSYRVWADPSTKAPTLGFRVAMSPSGVPRQEQIPPHKGADRNTPTR
jgi:formylglycine-generating enzyme required for sulfatase activity